MEYTERSEKHWEEEGLNTFVSGRFTRAALASLAIHSQALDAQIAREFLLNDDTDVLLSAVKLISKFGSPDDVETLLGISDRAWGGVKELAAATAIRLSPRPETMALELASKDDSARRKAGFCWLIEHDSPGVREYFRGLLSGESDPDRVRAVYSLSRRLNELELEAVLVECLEGTTYYYDVVAWLDKLLYTPRSLEKFSYASWSDWLIAGRNNGF